MTPLGWIILALFLWLAWAVVSWRIEQNPRRDPFTGLMYYAIRAYVRNRHHLRVLGKEHIPTSRSAGPLIIVCNHTAGIDPMLVQSPCPFFIRWMMANDMQWARLGHVWEFLDIIGVERGTRDMGALRDAIRHVRDGGVLGIFPEGKIARPRGSVLPFLPGVGMIAASSHAPVLPVFITGTPDGGSAWASLTRTSESRLLVGAPMRWPRGTKPEAITRDLERWFRGQAVNRGVVGLSSSDTPRPLRDALRA